MTRFAVEFAPRARTELLRLATWWQEHAGRTALVADELAEAVEVLSAFPKIGAPYLHARRGGVRKWLLPRMQVHLYYRVLESPRVVRVVAVWHTARRRGPRV